MCSKDNIYNRDLLIQIIKNKIHKTMLWMKLYEYLLSSFSVFLDSLYGYDICF